LRITRTAHRDARALGLRDDDIIEIIQTLRTQHFFKSMTTYANHRVWQDVYHADFRDLVLYVKFMIDNEGYLLISLKEK
jgi:motility quorum-sensing regulator/GCU-specific mRNA interferase toxin